MLTTNVELNDDLNEMQQEQLIQEQKKKKTKKLKTHSKVVNAIGFVIFAIYTFSVLGPIVWTFLNSLKDRFEYMQDVVSLPKQWLFSNYLDAFEVLSANGENFFGMFFNSVWLSIAAPTIHILTAAMASYVMAKYKFPGKGIIWGIMITIMVIPIYGSTASTYKMYKFLNIYDTPMFLITTITGLGGSMMMIAAFESVSTTYMEAAFLDGAGHARVFFSIMLPQMTGLMSALWIIQFIGDWNNYMRSLMYLPSYTTLMTGLYVYQIEQGDRGINTPILFAGSLLCCIPAVTLFIAFQDKFLNMSYGGGIKG